MIVKYVSFDFYAYVKSNAKILTLSKEVRRFALLTTSTITTTTSDLAGMIFATISFIYIKLAQLPTQ